mgnify:FL=1
MVFRNRDIKMTDHHITTPHKRGQTRANMINDALDHASLSEKADLVVLFRDVAAIPLLGRLIVGPIAYKELQRFKPKG